MITAYRDHVGWVNLVAGPTLLAVRDLKGHWLVCAGAGGRRLDDLVRASAAADQKYPLRRKVKRVDVEHHNGWWYAKVRDGFVDMFQRRPTISELEEAHPSYDWSEAYCIIHDAPPAPAKPKVGNVVAEKQLGWWYITWGGYTLVSGSLLTLWQLEKEFPDYDWSEASLDVVQ